MRTAVDTTILLDVLAADPVFGELSREALRGAYRRGGLVVCDVVWSEVRASFPADEPFREALTLLGIRFDPVSAESAALAGALWRAHRKKGVSPRARLAADFLIGAHAKLQSDALLTRDRGFFRVYFDGLEVLDPTA